MTPSTASRVRALSAVVGLGAAGVAAAVAFPVTAQPPAPAAFCEVYPEVPACAGGAVDCAACHETPPALNLYGADISAALSPGEARPLHEDVFLEGLDQALLAIEGLDSDGDGFANIDELTSGSSPADPASTPTATRCTDADPSDGYDVCAYDYDYTFKKVFIDFCGRSPTLYEREEFRRTASKSGALHEALDTCLDSEHWRGIRGRVWNLANPKIAPQQAVKSGRNPGEIPLADYDDDYAYWVWTQTDDRDARLVLTGQNFVSASFDGTTTTYEAWDRTPSEDEQLRGYDRFQNVRAVKRAGLLTHRWFLMSNTMFTGVPRTTAAQAYRAYLGLDIARLEGLSPVDGEPVDYDSKGVAEPGCAACHSTLDPLTYPFSRYEGIDGGRADAYSYSSDRMLGFVDVDGASVADTPEAGVIFGQEVADLTEWAQVAANSEAFRKATVSDYWEMLLGEPPRASEQAEYTDLVDAFGTDHGHNVEAMLHDLIDTEAYGAP